MKKIILQIIAIAITIGLNPADAKAQGGDQILDGIGETALVARYLFDGNIRDWSRNNLHARLSGTDAGFADDKRFGKVLSLSVKSDAFVTLSSGALSDLESLTVSGWVYLRSGKGRQHLFDFGSDTANHLFVAFGETTSNSGLHAVIASKNTGRASIASSTLELNKWIHIAVVVDVPARKMTAYVDSKLVGIAANLPVDIAAIVGTEEKAASLYIGKSLSGDAANFEGLIHDFRIYRVPLNERQVAGIFYRNRRGLNEGVVNTTGKKEDDLPKFADDEAQLYNAYLVKVADVKVETGLGNLPRLPARVAGIYRDGIAGPDVRVIWPEATDNTAALKPGTYTVTGRVAGTDFHPVATVTVTNNKVAEAPSLKLETFNLGEVTLDNDNAGRETKFIENRDKFIDTLAATDPNSFLYMFRHAFGQVQPAGAKALGVWDSKETKLRGHATGHYLSALAQAYAGTGYNKDLQKVFLKKINYMVDVLYQLSNLSGRPVEAGGTFVADPTAIPVGPGKTNFDSDLSDEGIRHDYWNWGKGFISAYPPDQFIMLEHGAKYGGQKTQIWAPYYTLHKILAGLMDVYQATGNEKALAIATGMGDWVYDRLSKVPSDTLIKMWNTYIAGEFGGMNEAMARMYIITGKKTYLETARLFDNVRVFYGDTDHSGGLAKNVDLFRGLHANQHIPQIVGSMETYLATNNPEYYNIADNFWHKIVNDYMYSIGGVAGARNPANAECFISQPGTLYENGFSSGGQNETCATYNMLKLTGDLFLFDQRAELMDYYERALYNDILASVAENSPANTYHVPLRPGSFKQFSNARMTGFTCCNGTALESSTKLQNSIYFRSKKNDALYVNLYIPSILNWTEQKVKIVQSTNYPKEDNTRLTIEGSGTFDIHVRVPGWATKGFFVKINGKEQRVHAAPGSYLKLSRKWRSGDVIELRMPFQFHLDPVMDQQNVASLFWGPVLLAAQEPAPRSDWRKITLDAHDLSRSIKGDPEQLEFTVGDTVFKPFYNSYGRYSVYLDVTLK